MRSSSVELPGRALLSTRVFAEFHPHPSAFVGTHSFLQTNFDGGGFLEHNFDGGRSWHESQTLRITTAVSACAPTCRRLFASILQCRKNHAAKQSRTRPDSYEPSRPDRHGSRQWVDALLERRVQSGTSSNRTMCRTCSILLHHRPPLKSKRSALTSRLQQESESTVSFSTKSIRRNRFLPADQLRRWSLPRTQLRCWKVLARTANAAHHHGYLR